VNEVVDIVVDGGGSTTRTGVAISGRLLTSTTGPSVNPYSVGKALASRELRNVLQYAVTMRPKGSTVRAVSSPPLPYPTTPHSKTSLTRHGHRQQGPLSCPRLSG
jgi:hypothetical protein